MLTGSIMESGRRNQAPWARVPNSPLTSSPTRTAEMTVQLRWISLHLRSFQIDRKIRCLAHTEIEFSVRYRLHPIQLVSTILLSMNESSQCQTRDLECCWTFHSLLSLLYTRWTLLQLFQMRVLSCYASQLRKCPLLARSTTGSWSKCGWGP